MTRISTVCTCLQAKEDFVRMIMDSTTLKTTHNFKRAKVGEPLHSTSQQFLKAMSAAGACYLQLHPNPCRTVPSSSLWCWWLWVPKFMLCLMLALAHAYVLVPFPMFST
jgi:hypothetical protein